MKKIYFFLFLICSSHLFAQSAWIINETFPETRIKWLIKEDTDYVSKVTSNGYDVECKSKNEIHIFGSFALHNNIDFFVEVSQTQLHTKGNVGSGIIFGCNRSTKQDGYSFLITKDGNYAVMTLNGLPIIKPHFSKYITRAPNAVNKLKVMQLGGKWLFWINDNQVDFTNANILFGEDAGFIVGSGGHVSFTSIKVYDLTAAKTLPAKKNEPWYAIGKYDNFNNNDDKWIVENTEGHKFSFDNGYVIQKKNKGNTFIFDHSLIRESDDFMNEVEVEHIDGTDEFGYGLLWGLKDEDNRFEFKITASGYYKISKLENKEATTIQAYTESKYIKQGNNISNILTLKNIGQIWFFFINDKEVFNCPAQEFYGDKAGLVVYEPQTIKLHSLKTAKLMYAY